VKSNEKENSCECEFKRNTGEENNCAMKITEKTTNQKRYLKGFYINDSTICEAYDEKFVNLSNKWASKKEFGKIIDTLTLL